MGKSNDPLRDFLEGQWWVKELDAVVANGTHDQKRAVAVVHNLLRVVAKQEKPIKCDHVVSIVDDYEELLLSGVEQAANVCQARWDAWAQTPSALPEVVAEGRKLTPRERLGREYPFFVYCPKCGERLPDILTGFVNA